MYRKLRSKDLSIHRVSHIRALVLTIVAVAVLIVFPQQAQTQNFRVIYEFSGAQDGSAPYGELMIRGGSLFGTNYLGGSHGCGTVYQLITTSSTGILLPIHSFTGGKNDGAIPWAGVALGPDGTLYGTTGYGGPKDHGTVFNARPSPLAKAPWRENVLYSFGSVEGDGNVPSSVVAFDAEGNSYGTTIHGGDYDYGTVYKLTPSQLGWTESIIHSFTNGLDGGQPRSAVILDKFGNLYGTASSGGIGYGTVFKLTPSGSGWTETAIYTFQGGSDGATPYGGLIWDETGNLYGATTGYGAGNGGSVFMLSPSNEGWIFTLLYALTGEFGPTSTLAMDSAGNLYGTASRDGRWGVGNLFKLTKSHDGWSYSSLHDFTGQDDGKWPHSNLVFDMNGNLYGTANAGGRHDGGVVFEISPE